MWKRKPDPIVKTVVYREIRDQMRVGDFIGCRGQSAIQKAIRFFRGGFWNFSHASIIIEDVSERPGSVEVFEALGGPGMVRTRLSKAYVKDHGHIFWAPMKNEQFERDLIQDEAKRISAANIDYDYGVTFLAIFKRITLDAARFNCSELFWYLQRFCGRVKAVWKHGKPRKKNEKELAPCPGNAVAKGWADCPVVYRVLFL
jgi:hypothetical protein